MCQVWLGSGDFYCYSFFGGVEDGVCGALNLRNVSGFMMYQTYRHSPTYNTGVGRGGGWERGEEIEGRGREREREES